MRKIVLLLLFLSTAYSMDFPFFKSDSSNDTEHVYLLHGLGRTRSAMLVIGARLKKAGFDFTLVGYPTLNKSTDKILAKVAEQINETLPDHKGTIHFVGHSLGGLMIRAYLENNQVDSLGKVVLMGTPNQGTVLVDRFRDKWWMKMLGPMTLSLGTDENSFPSSLADPYYPIGIIAANTEIIKNEKLIPGQDDVVVPG
jgi:triacylglycerol esterase/lipase EstA (alpha/beta hydrolase family)